MLPDLRCHYKASVSRKYGNDTGQANRWTGQGWGRVEKFSAHSRSIDFLQCPFHKTARDVMLLETSRCTDGT